MPYDWATSSIEKHSLSAPIRMTATLTGEQLVATEESLTLTQLIPNLPRSEEESQSVGAISKWAHAKVGESVLFLSQRGMQFVSASRTLELPSQVKTLLSRYELERIPGIPPLTNMRRASGGFNGGRNEFWLHLPSSIDLWTAAKNGTAPSLSAPQPALDISNALPQRTIVWRFWENDAKVIDIRNSVNYSFDLSEDFALYNLSQLIANATFGESGAPVFAVSNPQLDLASYNSTPVLFESGSDGSLWASWVSADGATLHTINCDDDAVEQIPTGYFTLALTAGPGHKSGSPDVHSEKRLRKLTMQTKARGVGTIITGIPKRDSSWDAINGPIHGSARSWPMRNLIADEIRSTRHPLGSISLETTGKQLYIRMLTKPDALGRHYFELLGLTAHYVADHDHA
jgi:hypothetical protein